MLAWSMSLVSWLVCTSRCACEVQQVRQVRPFPSAPRAFKWDGVASQILSPASWTLLTFYFISARARRVLSKRSSWLPDGTCTRDPNMNLIIQYGLLGLVFGLGLGLGFILY